MTNRKLENRAEREIALSYLCGVDLNQLAERWRLSTETIKHNIIFKRSREWNDPLVEFYRQTPPYDRARNAIHLYLAFSDQGESIHNIGLVQDALEVHQSVGVDIFDPRTKKLIEETNLEKIIETSARTASPEQKLFFEIFGVDWAYGSALKLVKPLVYGKLREAYAQVSRISLDKVYDDLKNEIYAMLGRGILPEVQRYAKEAEARRKIELAELTGEVLGTLTPKEAMVLKMVYGIDCAPLDYKQTGREFAVTDKRIRQIEGKALRKLRHPSRSKKLLRFL